MSARIVSIGTAVPPTRVPQERVRDFFAAQPGVYRHTQRLSRAAFDAAAIDQRHTVLSELADLGEPVLPGDGPFVDPSGALRRPTTGTRNDLYTRAVPGLCAQAA